MTVLPKYEAKQVGNCTSVDCALWDVRPISKSQRTQDG